MEFVGSNYGEQGSSCSWRFLRKKKVDSNVNNNKNSHGVQLAKELTVPHLMAIGNSNIFSYLLKLCCFENMTRVFHKFTLKLKRNMKMLFKKIII